jgi:DNA polymerase-3 subunit alpha
LEFKPKEMRLLEGIGESLTTAITLKMALDALTPELVEQLDELCRNSGGPHRLRVEITDRQRQLRLQMAARERKVLANNDFVAALDRLGIAYSLN